MNEAITSGTERLRFYRKMSRPYAVYLYIWGIQWIAAALLHFFGQWRDLGVIDRASFAAAVALSLVYALFGKRSPLRRSDTPRLATATLCVVMLIGTVMTLDHVQAIDPFFVPLLHGFVLALAYSFISMYVGRPLLYLGMWMFALTVVVALRYLGYATLLLEGFGGISMLAFGWLIGEWNRGRRRKKPKPQPDLTGPHFLP